jgi:hypothetical protein
MIQIDSYEDFCKAFNGDSDDNKRAELLLFLRDWLIRIIDNIDEESVDYSLDMLLVENADKSYLREVKKDALSRLIDDSFDAIRRISESMRENIIRENVKLPVYKVREVNSYGLNWLSRRPGSTVKEKISSANSSMMAVQRRMSLDTGENRLFIAYLKEILELLQNKIEGFPKNNIPDNEMDCYSQVASILRNPDFDEIRRWENMPPNNTLLSDQNYKKIWRCWNELKQLDDLIKADNENIDVRLCQLFVIEFFTRICNSVSFPQIPLKVDYFSYNIELKTNIFVGVDTVGNIMQVSLTENTFKVSYNKKQYAVSFDGDNFEMIEAGNVLHNVSITTGTIYRYVDVLITKLGIKKNKKKRSLVCCQKYASVIMDVFALRPMFIADENGIDYLNGRLLYQKHVFIDGDAESTYYIPCDISNAILVNDNVESFNISSVINDQSGTKATMQMSKLFHLLEEYVTANNFTFLFPDIYDEFQLSQIHKSARLVYNSVRALPRSIGVAFSYFDTDEFSNNFRDNDFLLVVDVVEDNISLTLLQGLYDSNVENDIPEYGGIIWERHPSISYSIHEDIEDLTDKLLAMGCIEKERVFSILGMDGFESELDGLIFIFDNKNTFRISDRIANIVKQFKINITEKINVFLIEHKEIIGNNSVHVISLSENVVFKGNNDFLYAQRYTYVEGCKHYYEMQERTSITLWRDHLPELAIKLLYGKFNLVNNETITPEFNVEKKIQIDNTFTLVKNKSEYHFSLVQNDVNKKTRYAAVVKLPYAVNHDVECRLDMTYQYGAEEPYRLLFIPIDKNAGFVEAKVSWEKATKQPYMDLDVPDEISSLSWKDMYEFAGRRGKVNLVQQLINTFNAIERGYQCVDVSDMDLKMKGEKGKRSFVINETYGDEDISISFVESNTEKREGKNLTFNRLKVISFEMNESKTQDGVRYSIDLRDCFRDDRTIWNNKGNGYACYPYMFVDGKRVNVAFFENQFDDPESFHPGITRVSFELAPYQERYKAVRIHDEDSGKYKRRKNYYAINIRKGNVPGQFIYNGWVYFMMLSMFTGKNSIYDSSCPMELREAFENARESWIDIFNRCDDDYIQMRMFSLMSIVAKDIGDKYFEIAQQYVTDYASGNRKLSDYIGYALGDCRDQRQIELFNQIIQLEDEKVVCILSKAIWGNEDFVWNVPIAKLLEYFDFAVVYLKELSCSTGNNGKDITMCLEFLLGVLRLRKYKDEGLNYKLSMNNPIIRELYDTIEYIIDNKTEIRSFLALNVENKGIYEDIPDLLYAMLVYVSGEKGAEDIKISGLNLDDVEV